MKAERAMPAYRGLRTRRGITRLGELDAFARWFTAHLNRSIIVQGVTDVARTADGTHVTAPVIINAAQERAQQNINTSAPAWRPRRVHGPARRSDLASFAARILPFLKRQLKSTDLDFLRRQQPETGDAEAKQKSNRLLPRRDFARFIQRLGRRARFRVVSDEISAVRDTGNGLHIRRRYHGPVTLTIELQARWCIAKYCILAEDGGVAYTASSVTTEYENGSIEETFTIPDVGPHYETPAAADHTCAAADYATDEDPEFDYGELVEVGATVYSGAVDATALLALALANVANDGSPTTDVAATWPTDLTPPAVADINLGSWSDGGDPLRVRRVDSYQYRWHLTGGDIRLQWDQGGTSYDIDLDDGDASSWYDDVVISLAMDTADKIENVVISEY